MAWLDEHPNPNCKQQRIPRREPVSGVIVVHTAENTPDYVAFDGGAEGVRDFIGHRDTYGSYHTLADSDSIVRMVEFGNEAFHDATTGGNRHEIGISAATRADVWPLAPQEWRDGCIEQLAIAAAQAALYVYQKRGIVIPAQRISRPESEARKPGFISHGERDPKRRTDPGAQFPWEHFLARYAFHAVRMGVPLKGVPTTPNPTPEQIEEQELMTAKADIINAIEGALPTVVRVKKTSDAGEHGDRVYCLSAAGRWWVPNDKTLETLYATNVVRFDQGGRPKVLEWAQIKDIPLHPNSKR